MNRKEYNVLRHHGTEAPRSHRYNNIYPKTGYFACRACGLPLYGYHSKFDSSTGWPSFGTNIEGNVTERPDFEYGIQRQEVCCARCESHLGHVFAERSSNKFDHLETFTERQCINGVCLHFINKPLPDNLNPKATAL